MKDRKKAEANAEMRMQMIAPLLSPDLDRASMSALKQSLSEHTGKTFGRAISSTAPI